MCLATSSRARGMGRTRAGGGGGVACRTDTSELNCCRGGPHKRRGDSIGGLGREERRTHADERLQNRRGERCGSGTGRGRGAPPPGCTLRAPLPSRRRSRQGRGQRPRPVVACRLSSFRQAPVAAAAECGARTRGGAPCRRALVLLPFFWTSTGEPGAVVRVHENYLLLSLNHSFHVSPSGTPSSSPSTPENDFPMACMSLTD